MKCDIIHFVVLSMFWATVAADAQSSIWDVILGFGGSRNNQEQQKEVIENNEIENEITSEETPIVPKKKLSLIRDFSSAANLKVKHQYSGQFQRIVILILFNCSLRKE